MRGISNEARMANVSVNRYNESAFDIRGLNEAFFTLERALNN
jgi:hypothetical protein